jgi:hypothetical protein
MKRGSLFALFFVYYLLHHGCLLSSIFDPYAAFPSSLPQLGEARRPRVVFVCLCVCVRVNLHQWFAASLRDIFEHAPVVDQKKNCAERSAWHGDGSLLRRTPLHPLRSPLTRRMREDLKRRLAWDLRAGLRGGLRKRQRGGRRGRGGTRRRTLIEHGSGKARNDA